MEEIWRDIKGYEGHYQISNCGNVKNIVTGNIISKRINKAGYYRVSLYSYIEKKSITKEVHRLVAENFFDNIQKGKEVNHKDGNKLNNNVNNLEWITHKQNIEHAWANNLFEPVRKASKRYGRDNPAARCIIQYDKNGNKIKEYESIIEAVKITNINRTNIGKCCNGKRKTAGGYIWKFKNK